MASRTLEVQENMEGIALNLLDIACKKTHSVTDRAKIKKYAVMMQDDIQKFARTLPWKDRMAYKRIRMENFVECSTEVKQVKEEVTSADMVESFSTSIIGEI